VSANQMLPIAFGAVSRPAKSSRLTSAAADAASLSLAAPLKRGVRRTLAVLG
jgi:hypothetical protein